MPAFNLGNSKTEAQMYPSIASKAIAKIDILLYTDTDSMIRTKKCYSLFLIIVDAYVLSSNNQTKVFCKYVLQCACISQSHSYGRGETNRIFKEVFNVTH